MLVVTLFSPPVVHRTLGFIFWWSRSHWYRKMVPWEASYEREFCGQWGHINPWNGYQREDSFKKRRDTTKLKAYSSALSWCPSERQEWGHDGPFFPPKAWGLCSEWWVRGRAGVWWCQGQLPRPPGMAQCPSHSHQRRGGPAPCQRGSVEVSQNWTFQSQSL